VEQAESSEHVSEVQTHPATLPTRVMQRPFTPVPEHWLSFWQAEPVPSMQSPAGTCSPHCASLALWFAATRPALLDPLPESPWLDELARSTPSSVSMSADRPQAERATAAITTSPDRCMLSSSPHGPAARPVPAR